MEVMSKGEGEIGSVWVAQKIPDGYVAGHANQARIRQFVKDDPSTSRFAHDVIDFARKINRLLVITRGDQGAVAINNDEVIECTAKKNLKIKDLTGAGDLFAGGFLHGLINNKSIKESLETGTDMSSKVIQIIGARLNK